MICRRRKKHLENKKGHFDLQQGITLLQALLCAKDEQLLDNIELVRSRWERWERIDCSVRKRTELQRKKRGGVDEYRCICICVCICIWICVFLCVSIFVCTCDTQRFTDHKLTILQRFHGHQRDQNWEPNEVQPFGPKPL